MIYSEGNSLVVIQWLGLHSLTRAQVQSLDGELRSHKPSSAAKKKKKKTQNKNPHELQCKRS